MKRAKKEKHPKNYTEILWRHKNSFDGQWTMGTVQNVSRTLSGRYWFDVATGYPGGWSRLMADEVIWEYPDRAEAPK